MEITPGAWAWETHGEGGGGVGGGEGHFRDSQQLICKGRFWVYWWEQNQSWRRRHVKVFSGVFKGQSLPKDILWGGAF